jgi:multiple sugar transport system permease protein
MSKGSSFTLPPIIASARTGTSLGGTDWDAQTGITIDRALRPRLSVAAAVLRVRLMSGAVK